MRSHGDVKAEKPPKISNKTTLLVALWRLRIELDAVDWTNLDLTQRDVEDIKTAWAAIVASVRDGMAARQRVAV